MMAGQKIASDPLENKLAIEPTNKQKYIHCDLLVHRKKYVKKNQNVKLLESRNFVRQKKLQITILQILFGLSDRFSRRRRCRFVVES